MAGTVDRLMGRVRAAHLLVRTAEEWTELNFGLLRAYMAMDNELVDDLERPCLHAWRSVARTMVNDELEAAGITVSSPEHPWGIAVLSRDFRSSEPLLCDAETEEDSPEEDRAAAAVYGGLWLTTFDGVMDNYRKALRDVIDD